MKVGTVDKVKGDVIPLYCIDERNNRVEVAKIDGTPTRPTTTLIGYIPVKHSIFEQLEESGCDFDFQIHYGECTNPTAFNEYESAYVFKNAHITNISLSELTTLSPDGRTAIEETVTVSLEKFYRITPISESVINNSFTTPTLASFGVGVWESIGCDTCNTCDNVVVGMYGTDGIITFGVSVDAGITWDLNSIDASIVHNGQPDEVNMVVYKETIYFCVKDAGVTYIYSININSLDSSVSASLIATITGSVYGLSVAGDYLWLAGTFVHKINLYTNVIEYIDTPDATSLSIHAIDNNNAVIGGFDGYFYRITNNKLIKITEIASDEFHNIKQLTNTRIVASGIYGVYYSCDNGLTWKQSINTINRVVFDFYDNIVGYAHGSDIAYKTIDGGITWKQFDNNLLWSPIRLVVCNQHTYYAVGSSINVGNSVLAGKPA